MNNDLKEPIEIYGKGSCPVCKARGMMTALQIETTGIILDKEGLPIESYVIENTKIACVACGYVGKVGEDYIQLEDGSYKFVTEAGKIYEEERMKNLPKKTHLNADGNPFMITEKGEF